MNFWSFLLRVVLAVVIFAAVAALFAEVLPLNVALAAGTLAGLAELIGPALGGKGGSGVRWMLHATLPVVAWPLAALGFSHFLGFDRLHALAAGCIVAAAFGLAGAGHGGGHERARLATVAAAAIIPIAALLQTLPSGDYAAVALSSFGVAVAFGAAKVALVWPDRLEDLMLTGGAAAAVSATVAAAMALV